MDQLFYELIQVALGNRSELSHIPSKKEWEELFQMSVKQSLIGINFAALKQLAKRQQTENLPKSLKMQWLGLVVRIQKRNEYMDEKCIEVQKLLSDMGFRTSILKGQGLALLYGANLCTLRQSGDIDIWLDGGMGRAYTFCKERFGIFDFDYINAHAPFYDNVEVELHWRVHSLPNPCMNKRIQRWFEEHKQLMFQEKKIENQGGLIVTPHVEFNLFFIMLHCYHHMFESGLGLRQLMDYYFVLCSMPKEYNFEKVITNIKAFGMERFAKGVMWIILNVFVGVEVSKDDSLETCNYNPKIDLRTFCEPDEHEGQFLLKEIMAGGNFGHFDERKKKINNKVLAPFVERLQHNWHLASRYPKEFFWAPVWLVWHFVWKRIWLIRNN